jgi:hypothetical protein
MSDAAISKVEGDPIPSRGQFLAIKYTPMEILYFAPNEAESVN